MDIMERLLKQRLETEGVSPEAFNRWSAGIGSDRCRAYLEALVGAFKVDAAARLFPEPWKQIDVGRYASYVGILRDLTHARVESSDGVRVLVEAAGALASDRGQIPIHRAQMRDLGPEDQVAARHVLERASETGFRPVTLETALLLVLRYTEQRVGETLVIPLSVPAPDPQRILIVRCSMGDKRSIELGWGPQEVREPDDYWIFTR